MCRSDVKDITIVAVVIINDNPCIKNLLLHILKVQYWGCTNIGSCCLRCVCRSLRITLFCR